MRQKTLPISQLELDPKNPRLSENVLRTQEGMRENIAKTTSIGELMGAIGSNGFFAGENLIVVPKENEKEKYIVVEGNRRLAALQLLGNEEKSSKLGFNSTYSKAVKRPAEVPVAICATRNEVLDYLGNRHISGVKAWEPIAKARYIQQLLDREDQSLPVRDRGLNVARKIGSKTPTVLKAAEGLAVLNYAEEKRFFDTDEMDKKKLRFSVLTTALGYQGVRGYIASTEEGGLIEAEELKSDKTRYLFEWLLKPMAQGRATRLGDSRNIGKLAFTLKNPEATKALEEGKSLDDAHRMAGGEVEEMIGMCVEIRQKLRDVNSLIAEINLTDELRKSIEGIYKQVDHLKKWYKGEPNA